MIRPLKSKAKTILKIGAVLVIVAFIVFIWANVRPAPVRVQISFTGVTGYFTTNGYHRTNGVYMPTDGILQTTYFCVSNAGKCCVADRSFGKYEIKSEPFKSLTTSGGELKPGQFKTIGVISPRTTEPWRVCLRFYKVDWRYRFFQKPYRVIGMIQKFIPVLEPRGTWEFYSDWLNGNTNLIKSQPSLP